MGLNQEQIKKMMDDAFLASLFPPGRDNEFFDALYGGSEDGAFDIRLVFQGVNEARDEIILAYKLTERPGKCMACSLTTGLPPVFRRHPMINIKGIAEKVAERIGDGWQLKDCDVGHTTPYAPKVNIIPLFIRVTRTLA